MDNLYDICLESVMMDSYCTEGFKDTLKRAGKAVVKGVARAIDFLINVARQMINIFGNVIRKLRGRDTKVIEDKHIFENIVTVSKKVKKVKHNMAEAIATFNNVEVYDSIEQFKKSNSRTDDGYEYTRAHVNNIKNNIKDRHDAASKVMNDAYKNIMEDFVHDLNDIDSMKKTNA